MKRILTSIVYCTAATLLTGNALAQDQSQPSASGQQGSSLQQANAQEFFRASTLIGKNAQDSKGTKIGEIKDVSFNQQGEIFAFVDVGSGKWAAVPWQVVNPSTAKGTGNVTFNATAQQMKAGPAVSKDQWGSLNNPQFVQGCYTYYNVQQPTAMGGSSSPGSSSQSGSSVSGSDQSTNSTSQSTSSTNAGAASSPGGSSQGASSGAGTSQLTNSTSGTQNTNSSSQTQPQQ